MKKKIGRNAPCPCGSGKKFKKCCLPKDEPKHKEEQTAETTEQEIAPLSVGEKPDEAEASESLCDPSLEKWNAFYDKFMSEDYEKRIELFLEAIDDPGFLDKDGTFELLEPIFIEATKRSEHARFNNLMEELRQKLPEVYSQDEAHYLDWWISNALVLDQSEVLATKVQELAKISHKDIDVFCRVFDRLSYYGHLSLLLKAVRIAWPNLKTSRGIMSWAIDEFLENAINLEIFDYIEHCSAPDPNDPDLLSRLEYFTDDIRVEMVTEIVKNLSCHTGRQWSLDDFGNLKSETSIFNLAYLSREFLGDLYRERPMSLTKSELGRVQLCEYLLKRVDGDLEPKESMFEAVMNPRKRHKPKPKKFRPQHVLCPDPKRLDSFIASTLHFMNPQIYKAVASFEVVPDWLRFLESRGLIDEKLHNQTLNNLRPLRKNMEKLVENYFSDPAQRPTIKEF